LYEEGEERGREGEEIRRATQACAHSLCGEDKHITRFSSLLLYTLLVYKQKKRKFKKGILQRKDGEESLWCRQAFGAGAG
jgi:hypothetical protein